MIASSQSFSIIHLRILLSPLSAAPVKRGDPLNTIPILLPSFFILEIMCCRNSNAPSFILGRPAPNLPSKPLLYASNLTDFSAFFQSTPKGGFDSRAAYESGFSRYGVKVSPEVSHQCLVALISVRAGEL